MHRILLLSLLLLACKVSVFASHIVGGEFELLHLQNFQYRLNMILYFDELNGAAGAKDPSATVFIYRKSDNTLIQSFVLVSQQDVLVPYSNSDCDDGQLITSRLLYSATITLPEEDFSHPGGYYISWERCCRNYTISNIFSNDPSGSGIAAGQTFYLEFPPVTKNGEPFVNSTPRLFPPLRDYGCVDKFYFVDFGGVDDDGDSLVYTLVTPYSTIEPTAIPANPNPGPYPDVIWRDGYSIDNVMGGDPDLAISKTGLLTVTPKSVGLYVFAVKCEEFRDGQKIGEMRRDFQMLVVSNCLNETPSVRARELGESDFYNEADILNFSVADDDKCVEILVTDQPVSGDIQENVTIRAIPINFDAELEGIDINFDENVAITNELDTARFTVCFPDCPFTRNGFYQIGIIGYDDACPQPALDTVIVSLNVPPPPNQNAYFADSKGSSKYSTLSRNVTESAGGSISLPINAFDNDNDELTLEIAPLGFNLEDVGMAFTVPTFSAGEANTTFTWNFDCNADDLNFSGGRDVSSGGVIRKAFDVLLTAEDADMCEWEDPQTLLMTLTISFPGQTVPRVYRQGQPGKDQLNITHTIGETLTIPIKAEDADGDIVLLQGYGLDFNFEDLGLAFEPVQGPGVPGVTSNVVMPIDCQFDLQSRDSLNMLFIVEDLDECQLTNIDTLSVEVKLVPPINNAPQLSFASQNTLQVKSDTVSLKMGESIDAKLLGIDFQNDSLNLQLLNITPEPSGFDFTNVTGKAPISQDFLWTPACDVFSDNTYTEDFTFTFLLTDKNCYAPMSDTLSVTVHIEDINAGDEEFIPSNFFSPNNDPYNEFFGPYRRAESGGDQLGELINLLPIDNCAGSYQGVFIYNRWGKTVFESTDRDFKWYGKDEPAGVYFYHIKFTNRDFKGSITMMK